MPTKFSAKVAFDASGVKHLTAAKEGVRQRYNAARVQFTCHDHRAVSMLLKHFVELNKSLMPNIGGGAVLARFR